MEEKEKRHKENGEDHRIEGIADAGKELRMRGGGRDYGLESIGDQLL